MSLVREIIATVSEGNVHDLRKLLKQDSSKINKYNEQQQTLVTVAAARGNVEIMKALLDYGGDVNRTAFGARTSLMVAIEAGHEEMVRLLVHRNADASFAIKAGGRGTALAQTLQSKNFSMGEVLLAAGVDINQRDKLGLTALMYSSMEGEIDEVRYLLDHGANINIVCDSQATMGQKTALLTAAMHDHTQVVKLLLSRGATLLPPHYREFEKRSEVIESEDALEVTALLQKALHDTDCRKQENAVDLTGADYGNAEATAEVTLQQDATLPGEISASCGRGRGRGRGWEMNLPAWQTQQGAVSLPRHCESLSDFRHHINGDSRGPRDREWSPTGGVPHQFADPSCKSGRAAHNAIHLDEEVDDYYTNTRTSSSRENNDRRASQPQSVYSNQSRSPGRYQDSGSAYSDAPLTNNPSAALTTHSLEEYRRYIEGNVETRPKRQFAPRPLLAAPQIVPEVSFERGRNPLPKPTEVNSYAAWHQPVVHHLMETAPVVEEEKEVEVVKEFNQGMGPPPYRGDTRQERQNTSQRTSGSPQSMNDAQRAFYYSEHNRASPAQSPGSPGSPAPSRDRSFDEIYASRFPSSTSRSPPAPQQEPPRGRNYDAARLSRPAVITPTAASRTFYSSTSPAPSHTIANNQREQWRPQPLPPYTSPRSPRRFQSPSEPSRSQSPPRAVPLSPHQLSDQKQPASTLPAMYVPDVGSFRAPKQTTSKDTTSLGAMRPPTPPRPQQSDRLPSKQVSPALPQQPPLRASTPAATADRAEKRARPDIEATLRNVPDVGSFRGAKQQRNESTPTTGAPSSSVQASDTDSRSTVTASANKAGDTSKKKAISMAELLAARNRVPSVEKKQTTATISNAATNATATPMHTNPVSAALQPPSTPSNWLRAALVEAKLSERWVRTCERVLLEEQGLCTAEMFAKLPDEYFSDANLEQLGLAPLAVKLELRALRAKLSVGK